MMVDLLDTYNQPNKSNMKNLVIIALMLISFTSLSQRPDSTFRRGFGPRPPFMKQRIGIRSRPFPKPDGILRVDGKVILIFDADAFDEAVFSSKFIHERFNQKK